MAKKFTPKQAKLKANVLLKMERITPDAVEYCYRQFKGYNSMPLNDVGMVEDAHCSQEALDFYYAWIDDSDDLQDAINEGFCVWAEHTAKLIEADPEEYGFTEDDLDDEGHMDWQGIDDDGSVYTTVEHMAKWYIQGIMEELDTNRAYDIAYKRLNRNTDCMYYLPNQINITQNDLDREADVVINDIKWYEPETLYVNIKYA
jgi:hypothetical protein